MNVSMIIQDAPWINRRLLEGEHPTKDKICIISAYVNSCDEMDKFTEVNKKQYARKHGYTFHAYKGVVPLSMPQT